MKKLIPYLSYFFIILLSVFMVFFYDHPAFIVLSLCLIAFPFGSYFVTKEAFRRLEIKIFFSPSNLTKGYDARLSIHLHNPLRLPIADASASVFVRSSFYSHTDRRKYLFPLAIGKDTILQFPITLDKCGLYEAHLEEFEIWDYLHMFHFKKTVDNLSQLLVFPNSSPLEKILSSVYAEGFDEFEESSKVGNVSANVTDIREYQPGDRLQKIHWKLSSKLDKLFVKENESTSTNQLFLLTELYTVLNGDELERSLETTWAISLALINERLPFTLAVYSVSKQDFVTEYILNKEDLERAFTAIYYEKSYDTNDLALDIFRRCGMQKGTVLHISNKGVIDVTAT